MIDHSSFGPSKSRNKTEIEIAQRAANYEVQKVAEWLEKWICETIPKKKIEKALIYYKNVCLKFQKSRHTTFYRGIHLSQMPQGDTVTITPRPGTILEGWTADRKYAELMGCLEGGENAIVLIAEREELDIFLDTDEFDRHCPLYSWQPGEIIAQAKTATYKFYRLVSD